MSPTVRQADGDDVELAREMLAVADAMDVPAPLIGMLCDQAYRLTSTHSAGHATALEALRVTARRLPARRLGALEKAVRLCRRVFGNTPAAGRGAAGEQLIDACVALANSRLAAKDADGARQALRQAMATAGAIRSPRQAQLQRQLDRLQAELRLAGRVCQLRARAATGDTLATADLARLFVVELDRPAEAVPYASLAGDGGMTQFVGWAAGGADRLSDQQSLALGNWYRDLSRDAPLRSRRPLLNRARGYYERFLDRHPQGDLQRVKAKVALRGVEGKLRVLDGRGGFVAGRRDAGQAGNAGNAGTAGAGGPDRKAAGDQNPGTGKASVRKCMEKKPKAEKPIEKTPATDKPRVPIEKRPKPLNGRGLVARR